MTFPSSSQDGSVGSDRSVGYWVAILAITACFLYTHVMKRINFTYGRRGLIPVAASILLAILLLSESVFVVSTQTKQSERPDDQSCFVLPGNSIPTYTPAGMAASRSRQKLNPALVLLSFSHGVQNKCEYESMSANYRLTRYSRAHHVVHHQLLI
jgi:hypothetical protein